MSVHLPRLLRAIEAAVSAIGADVSRQLRRMHRQQLAAIEALRPRGRPPKVARAAGIWASARELWEVKGWSATRVAREIGSTHMAVLRRAREERWAKPPAGTKPAPAWLPRARLRYEAGDVVAAIAVEAGVSTVRIYQVATRAQWQRGETAKSTAAPPPSLTKGAAVRTGARAPNRAPRPTRTRAKLTHDLASEIARSWPDGEWQASPSGANPFEQPASVPPVEVQASVDAGGAGAACESPRPAAPHPTVIDPPPSAGDTCGTPAVQTPRRRPTGLTPAQSMAFRRAWNKGVSRVVLALDFELLVDDAVIAQAEQLGLAARADEMFPEGRGATLLARRAVMDRLRALTAAPAAVEASP